MGVVPGEVTLGDAHLPLRDQVADHVRSRISSGELPPGVRLVERDLAAQLGVSRIPVREALRRLETEGFVSTLPRRGVVVRSLEEKDVLDLFDVRLALEVQAVRLATERASTREVAEMGAAVADARSALAQGDSGQLGEANQRFHDAIVSAAHNPLLSTMLDPLQGRLHWLFQQNDDPGVVCTEHEHLFEAIRDRNVDGAGRLALAHVETSRELAMRLLFATSRAHTAG